MTVTRIPPSPEIRRARTNTETIWLNFDKRGNTASTTLATLEEYVQTLREAGGINDDLVQISTSLNVRLTATIELGPDASPAG